jgi:hypothetical protein
MSPRPAPPAAPLDSVRAVKRAMQDAALAPATLPGQVATFVQLVLAAGLAAAWLDDATPLVLTAVVLGASVVVGLVTDVGTWFRRASGVVVALCALFLVLLVHAVTDARLFGQQAPWVFLAVALVPIGLDWRFVPRLRARTVCSGLVVVPLIGAHEGWAFAGAVLWFVGAVVTLWVLERDVERAAMRPAHPTPVDPTPSARVADVLRPIAAGLAIGLVLAFLIGDVSCSTRSRSFTPPGSYGTPPSSVVSGSVSDGPLPGLDASGQPYDFRVDGQGRRWVPGTDGSRWYVDEHDGTTELRDGNGALRGEITDGSVTLYDSDGGRQTFTRDDAGGYGLRGSDGRSYALDRDGESWVIRDENGDVVAGSRPDLDPDHLYTRDPDGNVLVPDDDGDGRIPLPPSTGPNPLAPAPSGQTTTIDGDRVIVREPDGTTRTYDHDDAGRERVRVDDTDGVRTYVYDDTDDGLDVTEYDEDGDIVDRYRYDPQGRLAPDDHTGSSSSTSAPDAAPNDDEVPWRWIVAGVLLVAAVAAAVVALTRRRGPERPIDTDWAHRMSARIEAEGRRRGVVRSRGETVVDYAASLVAGPLPDARLVDVAQAVSAAMFGRREPDAATRAWVEQTLDEISTDHPAARRARTVSA